MGSLQCERGDQFGAGAVIGARHLLARAAPSDCSGLRQLAMTRHAGIERPGVDVGPNVADWQVLWARVVRQPTYLTLTGHTDTQGKPEVGQEFGPVGDGRWGWSPPRGRTRVTFRHRNVTRSVGVHRSGCVLPQSAINRPPPLIHNLDLGICVIKTRLIHSLDCQRRTLSPAQRSCPR